MTPITVAVTGPSGDVGHGIVNGLRESTVPVRILGLDNSDSYAASVQCDVCVKMPLVNSPDYIDCLIETLTQHEARYLFCGIDPEVLLIAKHKDMILARSGCHAVVADQDLVAKCSDKLFTARWLTSLGIATPKTWSRDELVEQIATAGNPPLPLIVKPRVGRSSQGVRVIHEADDLKDELTRSDDQVCFQEYLPGSEYTCGLLFDSAGTLRDWVISRRELSGGRTVVAVFECAPSVEKLVQSFGTKVSAHGSLNIQAKLNSAGEPCVFEINPRISGSTLMRLDAGYNDTARILENLVQNTAIERTQSPRIQVLREWTTAVVPQEVKDLSFSDTIDTIVFDCGGTILKLLPSPESICHRVLQQLGHGVPLRKVEEAYRIADFALKRRSSMEQTEGDRLAFYQTFNRLIANAVGIGSKSGEFHDRLYDACSGGAMHWTPVQGAREVLGQLTTNYRLFVLANWDTGLAGLLERLGLSPFLSGVYDSATLGAEKPDPRIFEQFIEQTRVDPSRAIYIGNEYEADVAASRSAGFSPLMLDFNHRYSHGVDCPYVISWDQLGVVLSRQAAQSPVESK